MTDNKEQPKPQTTKLSEGQKPAANRITAVPMNSIPSSSKKN